jgi:hypothetical protein
MPAPSYASEPQIQYLHQVLDQIAKAEVLIPDFQRPIRWNDDQRKRLLDSITRGTPIGAVMVWRTTEELAYLDTIGERALKSQPQGANRQYLLDGFQRLSTLFAALWPEKDTSVLERQPGDPRWALGYHLVNQEWVYLDETDNTEHEIVLPGRILLDSVALLRFQRRIKHQEADALIERADAVAKAVREYKIAIIPLVTESVEEAARTFALLNTEGTQMSQLDLINALTWTREWNLRAKIEDAREELNQIGWGKLDEKYLLAVLRAAVDLDLYEGKATDVAESLRKNNTLLDEAVNGVARAASFLEEHCDVLSLDLLPYSYQAVLLGDILRRHPAPSAELTKQLIQWFWWTTASSTFAGISGYRLTSMQKYLRDLADGKKGVWPRRRTERTPLPTTFSIDSARLRSLTIHLFRLQGRPESIRRRLAIQATRALVRGLHDTPHQRSSGNAFLLEEGEEQRFHEALARCRSGDTQELLWMPHPILEKKEARERHAISDRAWDLLREGQAALFIAERSKTLEEYEERFLTELGKPPGCP